MNKICTSIEQSKKLIELGIDINTADMHYSTWTILNDGEYILSPNQGETIEELQEDYGNQVIPAWSLSALLDVLKYPSLNQDVENKWSITDWTGAYPKSEYFFDSPVDACVGMIIKLHELKML